MLNNLDPSMNTVDPSLSVNRRVTAAIENAAAKTGVDFGYLVDQARIESGMRPDARARTSSATGLYQFTKQTWLATLKQHGATHGLGWAANAISKSGNGSYQVENPAMRSSILGLRIDPDAAAAMAAEFASDNNDYLVGQLGRSPEPVDLYLAHFLGAGGASQFLAAYEDNPETVAATLLPRAAAANRNVFYKDNNEARSVAEIRDNFRAKLGSQSPQVMRQARNIQTQKIDAAPRQQAPLSLATMQPMPKRLDLDFARNAYSRLASLSGSA
jgi:hypothetical protein